MGDDLNKRGQPSRKTCQHRVEDNRQNRRNWWRKRIEKMFCLREWDEQRESIYYWIYQRSSPFFYFISATAATQQDLIYTFSQEALSFAQNTISFSSLLYSTCTKKKKKKKIFRRHASWDPIVCYWKRIELDRNIISEKRACGSQQE